ncbi:MAG: hypothetical protein H7232_04105 [Aeromicrobium sp.]|nr:hypothetical protein [Burkholderiales bacterium]
MKKLRTCIAFLCLSVPCLPALAQSNPPSTGAGGYTPPPVSTTYRPLTGKLFFTDAERDRLDKARKDGVLVVDGEIVARSPQVEGFVRSSGGRTTYWVDGGQRIDAKPANSVTAGPSMTGPEASVKFRESGVSTISPLPPKNGAQRRATQSKSGTAAEGRR